MVERGQGTESRERKMHRRAEGCEDELAPPALVHGQEGERDRRPLFSVLDERDEGLELLLAMAAAGTK